MMKAAIFVALFGLVEAADEGDIVGLVFGGIAILALVVGVYWFYYLKQKKEPEF